MIIRTNTLMCRFLGLLQASWLECNPKHTGLETWLTRMLASVLTVGYAFTSATYFQHAIRKNTIVPWSIGSTMYASCLLV